MWRPRIVCALFCSKIFNCHRFWFVYDFLLYHTLGYHDYASLTSFFRWFVVKEGCVYISFVAQFVRILKHIYIYISIVLRHTNNSKQLLVLIWTTLKFHARLIFYHSGWLDRLTFIRILYTLLKYT